MTQIAHEPRYFVDIYALEERVAIRLEHIRNPTPKQEHDALNATLKDLREYYGELDVPHYPRAVSFER